MSDYVCPVCNGGDKDWPCSDLEHARAELAQLKGKPMSEPAGIIKRYHPEIGSSMYENDAGLYILAADHVREKAQEHAALESNIQTYLEEIDSLRQQLATAQAHLEKVTGWQVCKTHGQINADHAWGCPECVRELRTELATAKAAVWEQVRKKLYDEPWPNAINLRVWVAKQAQQVREGCAPCEDSECGTHPTTSWKPTREGT